ncbi:MAG: ribonuclease P protein component [Acidimicrobiales bacterium]
MRPVLGAGVRVGRISDRTTFDALRRCSQRSRSGPITVSWVEGGSSPWPRVAYAIGRRVGGAVVRNQIRRRLRGIFAEAAPTLPAGSYLVSVTPQAGRSSFVDLRTYVYQAVEALSKQGAR